MPASLKRVKTSSGAAAAAKTPSPKKSLLPKGGRSTDGKVGQAGAAGAAGATPGTKRKPPPINGNPSVAPQFGVKNIRDDVYARKFAAKAFGYNVDGSTAQPITYFNRTKGTQQRKILWSIVAANLQGVQVKYSDPDKFNANKHTLKLIVESETGRRLQHLIKCYFRMFWEYTDEGKSFTVDGDGDPEDWRAAVERQFEKIHPGKPMADTLQNMWQNNFGKNSEDMPMPDLFDLIWEFREDPGFHKKKANSNPSTLFAERIKFQPEEDNWVMEVKVDPSTEFDWPHLDNDGKFVNEKVSVQDIRRGDTFHQMRFLISANMVASTGAPSANFVAILNHDEVPWLLSANRGKLWIPRDQETDEQREAREAQEASEKAAKAEAVKELREKQVRACAGL